MYQATYNVDKSGCHKAHTYPHRKEPVRLNTFAYIDFKFVWINFYTVVSFQRGFQLLTNVYTIQVCIKKNVLLTNIYTIQVCIKKM